MTRFPPPLHQNRHVPSRVSALLLGCLLALVGSPSAAQGQDGGRLLLKGPPDPQVISPLLASELPSQLDKYARAARDLDALSVRFQESYQRFIRTLDSLGRTGKPLTSSPGCLVKDLADPYVAARSAWELYHQQARAVRTVQRRIQQYDQGGYSPGLTPDLQDRLRRALDDYERIRKEHVNLQALIKTQVEGEIRRIGCSPEDISSPAQPLPPTETAQATSTPPDPKKPEKPDPRTKPSTAPAVAPTPEVLTRTAFVPPGSEPISPEDDPESSGGAESTRPPPAGPVEQVITDERLLPTEGEASTVTPVPYAGMAPAVPAEVKNPDGTTATGAENPPAGGDSKTAPDAATPATTTTATTPTPAPPPPTPAPIPEGLRVTFSVDNRQCKQAIQVYLDGALMGTVSGDSIVQFAATEGKHRLCLGQEGQAKACSQNGDYIRVILYDGFAVRPRC